MGAFKCALAPYLKGFGVEDDAVGSDTPGAEAVGGEGSDVEDVILESEVKDDPFGSLDPVDGVHDWEGFLDTVIHGAAAFDHGAGE